MAQTHSKIPAELPKLKPQGATPAGCAEQTGVSQQMLVKKESEGWRGWGCRWDSEVKALHPSKVTLPLCFHAWMGSFITHPSCKLSNLEHTIYP